MDKPSSDSPCTDTLVRNRCPETLKAGSYYVTKANECACTLYYSDAQRACFSKRDELPSLISDWLHQCQQSSMETPRTWRASRYPRSVHSEPFANSTVSMFQRSINTNTTLPIIIVAVILTTLLLFFCWYRWSAIEEYYYSRRVQRMWLFFCCRHRPLRVRPRNTLSSWSIEDPEQPEELQFDPFAPDTRFLSTHSLSGGYSGLPGPSPHADSRSSSRFSSKILRSVRHLNPFKRRPVQVKSTPPKPSFEIVESGKPSSQGRPTGHVRLASSITGLGNYQDTTRTSPHSTISSSQWNLPKSPWSGSWKNPFKTSFWSAPSLFSPARVSAGDTINNAQASRTSRSSTDGFAEDTPIHSGTRDDTPIGARPSPGNRYTELGREDPATIMASGEEDHGEGEEENSVLLISHTPGIDFSLNFSQSSINSVHLSTPEKADSLSSNYPRHRHSASASNSSLEQYPSTSHAQGSSNEALVRPVMHAYKSSSRVPSPSHPLNPTLSSSSQDLVRPVLEAASRDTINRPLRSSPGNPTLLFPNAVRAAGYMTDKHLNHNRNISSDSASSAARLVPPS